MTDEALLSIDDLCVTFDVPNGTVDAVRHISFTIGKGESARHYQLS